MPSKKQHDLLSKSDIAKALGMTSQTFSNRQSRDKDFPAPTYSNRSGSVALYAPEDAKKVYEYCTRAERERLQKAEELFANLTGGGDPATFENVELPLDKEEAPAAKAETPAPAAKEAEKAPEAAAPAPKTDPAADKAAADKAAAEKAAKEKATADKIKAADAKIAANKTTAQAPAAKAPAKAPAAAPAAASKGTGSSFIKA